ncbi:MAG: NERD domain-containing protein [Candidatus Hydrogenedentes bacterium]|nr:NERD domain-containing protein [Candidatus Hydrogenedentota bacterium]
MTADRKNAKTRSPLKGKPLRNPGQSLDEEITRVLDEEVSIWIVMGAFGLYLAAIEWLRWATEGAFHPVLVSFASLCFLAITAYKVSQSRKKLHNLRLGRDGERAVGQYLDMLREKGYRVFHDVIGEGFNVDHVIVSPHGVFTVETKTFSKPVGKAATVSLRDGEVLIDGLTMDRNPVEQAKAQARWVNQVLRETTGKSFSVRPVIVFPGWFVDQMPKGGSCDVWVLNPKALPTFIENEPVVLEQQDVMLATYHLCRHVRTTN